MSSLTYSPSYAIPGLMPSQAVREASQLVSNSDGSLNLVVHEDSPADTPAKIEWALLPASKGYLVRDTGMLMIFCESAPGGRRQYLIRLPAGSLPVGTSILEVLVGGIMRKLYVRRNDSLFFTHECERSLFYLTCSNSGSCGQVSSSSRILAGTVNIPQGSTEVSVTHSGGVAPTQVFTEVSNSIDETPLSITATVVSKQLATFTVALDATPPTGNYVLNYLAVFPGT